jgi:hypothetical protein
MNCPQCKAENLEGKNFCSDCGCLLTPQLRTLLRSQVEEYVQEHFRDRNIVDVETTQLIAERFTKWSKWFLVPATILLTLLGLVLGLLGVSDYSDFRKTVQRASGELKPKLDHALREAESATTKSKEATDKAVAAINSINAATTRMDQQLASAQQLYQKVSGLEAQTANRIVSANRHVEERTTELDKKVETANREIATQQTKLTSTNELLTTMFSKGQVETFQPGPSDTPTCVVFAFPTPPGQSQKGAVVFMLLKSAPIFQTVQINYRIYVQPKSSYHTNGNVLIFFWGDPADSLKTYPLEVSYVPDPTYNGPTYSTLSAKEGHVFADKLQLQ